MKRAAKLLFKIAAFFVFAVLLYLGVAYGTAHIAGDTRKIEIAGEGGSSPTKQIYLISGLLHTDIAIPTTPELLERFSYLNETQLPLSNPQLEYLSFGWGSKAFYTTAGSYWDIQPLAVLKAVTGDESVMRIVGLGHIRPASNIHSVMLNDQQFEQLVSFVEKSFNRPSTGLPIYMPEAHLQPGDAFYKANGHFNIFHPCNQWVNEGLRYAGVTLGKWTPTSQSLNRSLTYFGSSNVQP